MTTFEKFFLGCYIILAVLTLLAIDQRDSLRIVVSGQEATIASYKENLTECLKDNKLSGQDEFTGE